MKWCSVRSGLWSWDIISFHSYDNIQVSLYYFNEQIQLIRKKCIQKMHPRNPAGNNWVSTRHWLSSMRRLGAQPPHSLSTIRLNWWTCYQMNFHLLDMLASEESASLLFLLADTICSFSYLLSLTVFLLLKWSRGPLQQTYCKIKK